MRQAGVGLAPSGAPSQTNPTAILKGALEAASPADRPTAPVHLGGPTPTVPARGTLDLTLWMARIASPLAPASDRTAIADVLALVERYRASPPRATPPLGHAEEQRP